MFLESLLDLSIPRNISLQHEQSRQSEASQLGTILSTTSSIQTNPGRTSRRFGPAPATNTTQISRLPRAKCSPWKIFLRMMIRNYKHQEPHRKGFSHWNHLLIVPWPILRPANQESTPLKPSQSMHFLKSHIRILS